MKNRYLLISLLVFFVVPACKTVITPEVPDVAKRTKVFEPQESTLNIPIEISIKQLEKTINANFEGLIYEDNSYTDNDNDGIKMTVKKIKPIKLVIKGNVARYTVPINLWTSLQQETYLGDIEGETSFDAELVFETAMNISTRWKMITNTKVISHKLLSSPQVKIGFVNIPISAVVKKLFKEYLPEVSKSIDEGFGKSFNLRKMMYESYKEMQRPTLVNENYETWMRIKPSSFSIQPLTSDRKSLYINIGMKGYVLITTGGKGYYEIDRTLPNLRKQDYLHPAFNVSMATQLSYESITKSLNQEYAGYVYKMKKKTVRIDSIDVFPHGDQLGIHVQFSGNAKGDLYFAGLAKYDSLSNEVYIDDFKFDIKSKKVALKAAEWLVKGPLKKKVSSMMRFSMDEQLQYMQEVINENLSENPIADNTYMKMKINKIIPKEIYTTDKYLNIVFDLDGQASIKYGKK